MVEEGKTPEGYKGTEIGIIPEDWDVQSLGTNSILKARIGWQGLTTAEYLTDGEYYLITGTDFVNGRIDWDNCYYVEKQRYEQDRNIQVRKKDILVTKDGTIGKVAFIDQVMGRATLNSGVFAIRPLKSTYEPEYLYHILMSRVFRDFLDRLAAGSTISHLYQKDFVHFEFPIPSITEQKAIAEALSDTDNLIQSLEKLIGKKKKIKLGAMQQLLTGRKRLPGFSGKWEDKTIGDLFEITAGGDLDNTSFSQHRTSTHKFPIYSNGLAKDSIYGYSSYSLHSKDAITVTARGTIGHAVYRKDDFIAIGRLLVLKAKYEMNNFMISELINTCVSFSIESTGVPQLTSPQIAKYEIKFPTEIQEQKAIAQVLSDMDAEIEALEEQLEKYKTIKQGMMQELLTGRIRLI